MTTDRVRVLGVTSEPPWPLNSGGHIRTFHLMKALAAETDLRLVCPVQPHQADAVGPLRACGLPGVAVPVGGRWAGGEAAGLLGAVARRQPYVMYRRHAWPLLPAVVRNEVAVFRPGVLYLDHLDSFLWRRLAADVPAVLDLHNVYSLLARRTADEQTSPLKRAFLRREARLLDRIERQAVRRCNAVFAVSEQEASHFRSLGANAVHVIPNGVDCGAVADLPTGRAGTPPTVLFLGTMSWGPNAAAATYLSLDVMMFLRDKVPGVRLLVVGRDPPSRLASRPDLGIEVTGAVTDVRPYLRQANVMAVPLDAGGGTRLKVLEAFAAGLPVVSTAVGAEGIEATPGVHYVAAEKPGFAGALGRLLLEPDRAAGMATAARELARDKYDWAGIGRRAAEVVRGVAAANRGAGRGR